MPRIIVTADRPTERGERPIMFTERVSVSDFESEHFQTHLVERLGWAVGDADAVEQDRWPIGDTDADVSEPEQHSADEVDAELELPRERGSSQRPRILV